MWQNNAVTGPACLWDNERPGLSGSFDEKSRLAWQGGPGHAMHLPAGAPETASGTPPCPQMQIQRKNLPERQTVRRPGITSQGVDRL